MELVNKAGALLGIITLFLGSGVYLYGTAKRGRADTIRQDNADLRASNQGLRTEKAGFEATIKSQIDTIRNLREVATQTPAVTQLLEMNNKQQTITSQQHSEVITQLSDLAKQISKMTTEFSHVARAISKTKEVK